MNYNMVMVMVGFATPLFLACQKIVGGGDERMRHEQKVINKRDCSSNHCPRENEEWSKRVLFLFQMFPRTPSRYGTNVFLDTRPVNYGSLGLGRTPFGIETETRIFCCRPRCRSQTARLDVVRQAARMNSASTRPGDGDLLPGLFKLKNILAAQNAVEILPCHG